VSNGLSLRGVVAASVLVVCFVVSYSLAMAAELKLSRMVWDFESVEQGESKTQKIVLANSGDQPLKIDKVELPEGCSVTPELANREIPAKEELEVEFSFDSQGILGKLQRYAYILLSDTTIVPLTIKGEVFAKAQPRLQVTPTMWDFGTIKVGESRLRTFRCTNVGTADLSIEEVRIYDSKFQVTRNIPQKSIAPGGAVDFTVTVSPKAPGKCETDFYVRSDSPGRKYTKISAKGYAVSKTAGVVVSPDLSSLTNNTLLTFEVTRTDKLGKEETLTLERDSRKSFPRETGPQRTSLQDYALTIKMVRPSPVTPKPTETTAPGEKPTPVAPKPGAKPAEEGTPPPEAEQVKEGTEAPGGAEEKEGEKPGEPEEEKEAAPSGKEEPEEGPEAAPAKPEEEKPSEGEVPGKEESPPAKPEEASPPKGSEKEEETAPEAPKGEKEPAAAPEKEADSPPEKPSGEAPPANR
jgi:hypothetical protein